MTFYCSIAYLLVSVFKVVEEPASITRDLYIRCSRPSCPSPSTPLALPSKRTLSSLTTTVERLSFVRIARCRLRQQGGMERTRR
ncbi:hypothetical protein I3760_06G071000 [Carya illinoinensis]|nr:hypothetical protein I3760_06G071000 [Carya illinoinensis]